MTAALRICVGCQRVVPADHACTRRRPAVRETRLPAALPATPREEAYARAWREHGDPGASLVLDRLRAAQTRLADAARGHLREPTTETAWALDSARAGVVGAVVAVADAAGRGR